MRHSNKAIIFLALLIVCGQLVAKELPKPLVETGWLVDNIEHVTILDVRADEKSFTANPQYVKDKKSGRSLLIKVGGHIPGASLVDYKNVRGEQKVRGVTIKHMILAKDAFEKLMQKAGVNDDSKIVIVTNAENEFDVTMAARMYWQIKYYGYDEVSILNGGTAQWLLDGNEIASAVIQPKMGNWSARTERKDILADSSDVEDAIDSEVQIVDVRPLGQYLGTYKSSKVGEKGHVPTAKSFPVDLAASRKLPVKFSDPKKVKEVLDALEIETKSKSITYCNSGHMAAGGWFIMYALLGNETVKLYDGSMHQWTIEKRPVVKMKME